MIVIHDAPIYLVSCAAQKADTRCHAADLYLSDGARVAAQLDAALGTGYGGGLVFLAGKHYRTPLLGDVGDRARIPMEGLGIGQRRHGSRRGRPPRRPIEIPERFPQKSGHFGIKTDS